MTITPTPVTAALAGVFSALVWPAMWSRFGDPGAAGSVELIVATLLLVALPAHAFVVGFRRTPASDPRALDKALFVRIGAWLVGAVSTVALMGLRTP